MTLIPWCATSRNQNLTKKGAKCDVREGLASKGEMNRQSEAWKIWHIRVRSSPDEADATSTSPARNVDVEAFHRARAGGHVSIVGHVWAD